ncbi:MAG: DUF1566 domain-containing protein [Treponema sp.]|nr:DUF1566 domain-containing protein [Treponema sp.]
MKRIGTVIVALFIAGVAFADNISIESFPTGQWLDANYDGVWEISPTNIRLLAKSGIILWDFSKQTVRDFKVSVDDEQPSLSFSCVESKRDYQFVKESFDDANLTLKIVRFGSRYSTLMEPTTVSPLEVDTAPVATGWVYAYKVGDTGPGGGIIYQRFGRVYSEAVQLDGQYKWQEAKDAAADYEGGGLTNWRAPSKDELNEVYRAKVISSGNFWSATASTVVNAWDQDFANGRQGSKGAKSTAKRALAIRSFEAADMQAPLPSVDEATPETSTAPDQTPVAVSSEVVGSTGPGGGIIYAVNGDQYSEVAVLPGSFNWAGAKLQADTYTGGGFTWRAPTDADLTDIYNSKVITSGNFWSSNDTNPLNAHDIRFDGDGNIGTAGAKSTQRSVLAVRTYTAQ